MSKNFVEMVNYALMSGQSNQRNNKFVNQSFSLLLPFGWELLQDLQLNSGDAAFLQFCNGWIWLDLELLRRCLEKFHEALCKRNC